MSKARGREEGRDGGSEGASGIPTHAGKFMSPSPVRMLISCPTVTLSANGPKSFRSVVFHIRRIGPSMWDAARSDSESFPCSTRRSTPTVTKDFVPEPRLYVSCVVRFPAAAPPAPVFAQPCGFLGPAWTEGAARTWTEDAARTWTG